MHECWTRRNKVLNKKIVDEQRIAEMRKQTAEKIEFVRTTAVKPAEKRTNQYPRASFRSKHVENTVSLSTTNTPADAEEAPNGRPERYANTIREREPVHRPKR